MTMTHSEAMKTLQMAYPGREAIYIDERFAYHHSEFGTTMHTEFVVSMKPGLKGQIWSFWHGQTLERCVEDCLATLRQLDPDPGDTAEPVKVLIAS